MSEKEEKEYLIPLEDIPTFLIENGISLQDFVTFFDQTVAIQSEETMNKFRDTVTLEQYEKTMARFKKSQHIRSQSFDRLFYTPIQYAILRYCEKTVKGKAGKSFGEYANAMRNTMTDINFGEPVKLTRKNIEFLKEDMRLNFKPRR